MPAVDEASEATQDLAGGTRDARWRVRSWDIRPTPYIELSTTRRVLASLIAHVRMLRKGQGKRDRVLGAPQTRRRDNNETTCASGPAGVANWR